MRSDVGRRGQIGRLVRQRAVEWEVTRLLGPGAPRADGRATAVAGSDQCRLVGVEIGAYEAKTHLPELLEKARRGATITITKHGVPVARLVPRNRSPRVSRTRSARCVSCGEKRSQGRLRYAR